MTPHPLFLFGTKRIATSQAQQTLTNIFVAILRAWLCGLYRMDIINSSGQKKGGCGHIMKSIDTHTKCRRKSFKDGQCSFCSQNSECASCLKSSCSERRKSHVCCD